MKNIALFKIYIESGAKCDFCSGPFLDEKIEGLRNIFTGEKYLICKKCHKAHEELVKSEEVNEKSYSS